MDWKEVCRFVLLSRSLDNLEVNQLTPQGRVVIWKGVMVAPFEG